MPRARLIHGVGNDTESQHVKTNIAVNVVAQAGTSFFMMTILVELKY